jgi:hypothetical protein
MTRYRKNLLNGLIRSIDKTTKNKSDIEIHVTYDDDDIETSEFSEVLVKRYSKLNFLFHKTKRSEWMNRNYVNWVANNFCTGKYLLNLNDDVIFLKQNWDELAWEKLEDYVKDKPDGVVYGITEDNELDKINHKPYENFSCFPIISKTAVKAFGGFFDNEFMSWGSDIAIYSVYERIGRTLDLRKEIELLHISVHSKRRVADDVYKEMVGRMQEERIDHNEMINRDVAKLIKYTDSFHK